MLPNSESFCKDFAEYFSQGNQVLNKKGAKASGCLEAEVKDQSTPEIVSVFWHRSDAANAIFCRRARLQ